MIRMWTDKYIWTIFKSIKMIIQTFNLFVNCILHKWRTIKDKKNCIILLFTLKMIEFTLKLIAIPALAIQITMFTLNYVYEIVNA